MMKTDIEIAQECTMEPITEVAERAGIPEEYLEQYGKYKAKIDYNFLKKSDKKDGKLILVTAINPTPAGEGKTTTTVGLADALQRMGKKPVVALREPSQTGIRYEGWSSWRRICTGCTDGRYQPSFHREIFMRSELRTTYWQP